jgi:hypothetical protein
VRDSPCSLTRAQAHLRYPAARAERSPDVGPAPFRARQHNHDPRSLLALDTQHGKTRCRRYGRSLELVATADVPLPKAPIRMSAASCFDGVLQEKREPRSGFEPLISSHYLVYVSTPSNAVSGFSTTRQYQSWLQLLELRTQPYGHSKSCWFSIEVPLPPGWYLPRPRHPGA